MTAPEDGWRMLDLPPGPPPPCGHLDCAETCRRLDECGEPCVPAERAKRPADMERGEAEEPSP